jgi:hypothetical protein
VELPPSSSCPLYKHLSKLKIGVIKEEKELVIFSNFFCKIADFDGSLKSMLLVMMHADYILRDCYIKGRDF